MKTIVINGCYVGYSGYSIRHVRRINDEGYVFYDNYNTDDGLPYGSGACSKKNLKRWFEREATPEEIAKLRFEINAGNRQRLDEFYMHLTPNEKKLIDTFLALYLEC
jgi:hypothetical protein